MARGGVIGRSGRKRKSIEDRQYETDVIRYRAIHKSWVLYEEFLDDPNIDRNYKLQFAEGVIKKNIPQAPTIDQSQHITVTINNNIPQEEKVGSYDRNLHATA